MMTRFSLRQSMGMPILVGLILGVAVCSSTASAIGESPRTSVSPPGNEKPFIPSADPTAPAAADGNVGLREQGGSGAEVCRLRSHIEQQSGNRIMDAVGWIGDCVPDISPLIYTLQLVCIVETAGSWHEVSCTSLRPLNGNPPLFSYHAGWRCTVGVNYRARAYGVFSRYGAPLWSNPGISTSDPKLCT